MINKEPIRTMLDELKATGKYRVFNDSIREKGNFPTVDVGMERFRFAPTPFHDDEMIKTVVAGLKEVFHYYSESLAE